MLAFCQKWKYTYIKLYYDYIINQKQRIMKKDFSKFYIKLAVLAGIGMAICVWLRPEMFTASNILCWFYTVLMFMFFRMGLDSVNEQADFQIANWFALLGIEAALLLGVNFWFTPLFATLVAMGYFIVRSWIWKKELDLNAMWRSSFWLTVFNYVLMAVIKFGAVPLWHWFFE